MERYNSLQDTSDAYLFSVMPSEGLKMRFWKPVVLLRRIKTEEIDTEEMPMCEEESDPSSRGFIDESEEMPQLEQETQPREGKLFAVDHPAENSRAELLQNHAPDPSTENFEENSTFNTSLVLPIESVKCSCGKNLIGKEEIEHHKVNICCPVCFKRFKCETGLKQHWSRCKGDDFLKCVGCSLTLTGKAELATHLAKNRCLTCGKKLFCATALKNHQDAENCAQQEVQNSGQVFCPGVCGQVFKNISNLKKHQYILGGCGLTEEEKNKFKCQFCHFPLSSAYGLSEHQKKGFCCRCKLNFGCRRAVSAHISTCLPLQAAAPPLRASMKKASGVQIPDLKLRVRAPLKSSRFQKDSNLQCKKCSRKYDFLSHLVRHEKSCKWDRTCPHCDHLQLNVTALSKHVQQRHCLKCKWTAPCFTLLCEHKCEKEKEDTAWLKNCPYCEQPTLSEDSFKKHLTPAKCHRCGFAQTCEFLLLHHLEKCVSKGVLNCPVCA